MNLFVFGGAASGKSAFAESALLRLGGEPKIYLATLIPTGAECHRRIERHRALRAGKGFVTCERGLDLANASVPPGASALLECLTTLMANELFSGDGAGEEAPKAVLEGLERLYDCCRHTVVVSCDIFSDGRRYDPDTENYRRALGEVHRRLVKRSDAVVEVVCGIPVWRKGAWPDAVL